MNIDIIHLKDYYNIDTDPIIEIVRSEFDSKDKFIYKPVIIVPGGCYKFVGKSEGDPVSLKMLVEGYATIKLIYSTDSKNFIYHYPLQHIELCCAIDYIRNNGFKFDIDSRKIAIIGFSAGGHLVGSYSYKYKEIGKMLNISNISSLKPDVICLSYPVVTMKEHTHNTTKTIITNNDEKLINELSIDENIDYDYPPTFLWTTKEDTLVNPINTILLNDALNKYNVYHKTIIFEHGGHGMSIGTTLASLYHENNPDVQQWVPQCLEFFDSVLNN